MKRLNLLAVQVLVLIVASACLSTPTAAPDLMLPTPTYTPAALTPAPLTLDVLKNAEYQTGRFSRNEKVRLTDGTYGEETVVGTGSEAITTTLTITLLDQYATGDLNGDGVEDAAVVLVFHTGETTGFFFNLTAVLNEGGTSGDVASAYLGDRVQIESVSINKGKITVDVITQGPDDPLCCPTQAVTQKYVLQDKELVSVD